MSLLVSFAAGLLFAVGLCLSGMTSSVAVVGFLDVAHWDPRLVLTLMGASSVSVVAWRLRKRMARPRLAAAFPGPFSTAIDGRLALGSALFGVGWALSGFCPAALLVALGGGVRQALPVLPGMMVGMLLFELWERRRAVVRVAATGEASAR